jgi:glutamate racemase
VASAITRDAPIGVFDSGVGGLSVLREIRNALPHDDLLYVADSGAAPYGDQPGEFIAARARAITRFFVSRGAKAVVVACNTATAMAMAIRSLRSQFDIAIVAIEPAVKPAAALTRSGIIGILATRQTLASKPFLSLAEKHGGGAKILTQACPELVACVERGELDSANTYVWVEHYVMPLLTQGADTLVLGCTHYPFLAPVIREIAGPSVTVVDPAAAVAKELHRRLTAGKLLSSHNAGGAERFWTSSACKPVQTVITQLWGQPVKVHALPAPYLTR